MFDYSKKPLREQLLKILGDKTSKEDIEHICFMNNLNHRISETVYLYLHNSKDEVSDIMDVDGSTVIRRLKKFIDKMSKN